MTPVPCFVAVLLFGQLASFGSRHVASAGDLLVEKAVIAVKDEASIPAMESGVLTQLVVREGMRVNANDVLASIDDRQALASVKIAEYAEASALKRAKQTIEIRYAQAAAAVAEAEWQKALEANRIKKKAVSESEVVRAKLDFKRAELQIEKAANDRVLSGYDAQTKRAEREAAEMALEWRTIRAPFDGDVVKTNVHQSEWVNPGDTILKLMRFDTLYVEGRVDATKFDRWEVQGKPVTVEVTKARGQKETVSGTIVFVDQMLQSKGKIFRVRAEVKNELINDSWLLQPGGQVRMTIHLDSTEQAAKPSRRN